MNDYKKKLLVKYILEFIVIVVGISVTFWIDEWNRNRLERIQHIKDIESLVDDLNSDSLIINRVNLSLDSGRVRSDRLIKLIDSKIQNQINYKQYYQGIINVGYLWTYQTFFMTDATYKSLISNGRINLFPQQIHSIMNKYYEAISKRINDHNKLVDDIAIKYYSYYHPFSLLLTNENFNNNLYNDVRLGVSARSSTFEFSQESLRKFSMFFEDSDIKKNYTNINFYSNTLNLRNRIGNYSRRIIELDTERKLLSNAINDYLKKLKKNKLNFKLT